MSEDNNGFIPNTEDEARKIFESQMPEAPTSLGKASSLVESEPTNLVHDIGWVRVKPETLPSQGFYYPINSEITIRAASAAEIRHWSTIDEEDILSMDDALNRIIEKCCKLRLGGALSSYKDLKEIDRFFLVFAIRELTFKKGENALNVTFSCNNCGNTETETIVKEMLSYYTPADELQGRFSEEERCFHLRLVNGEELKLYLPTLGVMNYIKNFVKDKVQSKQDYDKAFLKWAPFLFADWRTLNDASYTRLLQDSYSWGTDKISVIDWFVKQMQGTVKPELKHSCTVCSEEATAPINFRGGVKSLFLVSDISSKLL
jgi:hypothetical protein